MKNLKVIGCHTASLLITSVFMIIMFGANRHLVSGGYLKITGDSILTGFFISLIIGVSSILSAYFLKHRKILRSGYIDMLVPLFFGIFLYGIYFFVYGDKSLFVIFIACMNAYAIYFVNKYTYNFLFEKTNRYFSVLMSFVFSFFVFISFDRFSYTFIVSLDDSVSGKNVFYENSVRIFEGLMLLVFFNVFYCFFVYKLLKREEPVSEKLISVAKVLSISGPLLCAFVYFYSGIFP